MKKQNSPSEKKHTLLHSSISLNRKILRDMLSGAIPMDIDLENRQIFFHPEIKEKLRFDFGTSNVDNLMKTYLDPKELKHVNRSLTQAEKGLEKPISFHFIHPLTSRSFKFEYHYQIVYVKYASTRLHGKLIKVPHERVREEL